YTATEFTSSGARLAITSGMSVSGGTPTTLAQVRTSGSLISRRRLSPPVWLITTSGSSTTNESCGCITTRRDSSSGPRNCPVMRRRAIARRGTPLGTMGPRLRAIGQSIRSIGGGRPMQLRRPALEQTRSEEHTSELQSRENLVCRLLLEKKKKKKKTRESRQN